MALHPCSYLQLWMCRDGGKGTRDQFHYKDLNFFSQHPLLESEHKEQGGQAFKQDG